MKDKPYSLKAAIIVAAALVLSALVWFFSPTKLLVGLVLVVMTYALLITLPARKFKEKGFLNNIKFKIPVSIALGAIIWFGAGEKFGFGFPIWWQIEFVAFALVGLLFFILLDLPAMKPERSTRNWVMRLIGTYAFASILFIVITWQLPQFSPEIELAKLNKKPLTVFIPGPQAIADGREIFESNKCFNCHKVFWEGNSDRGPNLGSKQIGLYPVDYIKGQILKPRENQSPGFEDKKSKKAMPTYYGDDLSDVELQALVAYLKTLRDPTHMPVEGKFPNQWTWWDDPKILAEGKVVFEGKEPATEGLNCAVCHGTQGIPIMTGAFDFRNPEGMDTTKMPDHMPLKLKDWPDELYYKRVTRGIDATPMAPWGMIFPHLYLWKAEAYIRTFHDPLDKRNHKKPVPPIPTKEEIERWKKEGLFMDPLL